jgi:hypothetical protein
MSLDLGAGDQQGPFNLLSPDAKVKSELAINIFNSALSLRPLRLNSPFEARAGTKFLTPASFSQTLIIGGQP